MSANRNKESIVLDLKAAGRRRRSSAALVRRTTYCWRTSGRASLDRLGFTVERLHELNPRPGDRLASPASATTARVRHRAGYDQIAQGEGGLMSVTGNEQPTKVGVPIADLLAGMNLAYGVVAALPERHRPGRGRVVRTSLLAGVVGVHAFQGTAWLQGGEGAGRLRRAPPGDRAVRDVRDRLGAGAGRGRVGGPVAEVRGRGRDGSGRGALRTNRDRVAHRAELIGVIEDHFATEPAEHWLDLLLAAGVPAGKVRSMDDVYAWEQVALTGPGAGGGPPGVRDPAALRGRRCRFDDNPFSGGRRHIWPPDPGAALGPIRAVAEG
jgi:crotonobetainyl-CoA:carnitine CoA-transferase CaiB-like acyl-CoA transferase